MKRPPPSLSGKKHYPVSAASKGLGCLKNPVRNHQTPCQTSSYQNKVIHRSSYLILMDHSAVPHQNDHIWCAPQPPMPADFEGSPLALHHSKQHLLHRWRMEKKSVVLVDYTIPLVLLCWYQLHGERKTLSENQNLVNFPGNILTIGKHEKKTW